MKNDETSWAAGVAEPLCFSDKKKGKSTVFWLKREIHLNDVFSAFQVVTRKSTLCNIKAQTA